MIASRLLAVTAVAAERDAAVSKLTPPAGAGDGPRAGLERLLRYELCRVPTGAGELTCVAGGVGPAAAAACTATLLAADGPYHAVLSIGVGGGFAGRAELGALVVADRVVLADLGADSPAGFLPLPELGLGEVTTALPADLVARAARRLRAAVPTVVGGVVTVSTATGTDERAAALAERHAPAAEGMEGGGVHAAAAAHGLPFLELRAVSNAVGRRDRGAWRLPEALSVLATAVATLVDEPVVT